MGFPVTLTSISDKGKTKRETAQTDTVTTYTYEYDDAGRLDSVYRKIGSGAKTLMAEYAYDDNGNRTSYTNHGGGPLPSVGAAAVEVDDQDRLLRYGDWRFTHNRNGETLTKADGATTFTFSYDPLGTLTGATVAADTSTTTIAYVLDPTGRRVGKKVGGDLVQGFLYLDAINPVAELDGDNDVVNVFVYATKGHVPDYMVRVSGADAGTYRLVTDYLGSVRLVVDVDSGDVVQRLDYDEYGNVLTDTHPGFQPFGFAGGLYDRDTNLVRFGARDYDPEVGRWTTKDPVLSVAGWNFYTYCGGDPINAFDALGLQDNNEIQNIYIIIGPRPKSHFLYGSDRTWQERGACRAENLVREIYPNAQIILVEEPTEERFKRIWGGENTTGVIYVGHTWDGWLDIGQNGVHANEVPQGSMDFCILIGCRTGNPDYTGETFEDRSGARFFWGYSRSIPAPWMWGKMDNALNALQEEKP